MIAWNDNDTAISVSPAKYAKNQIAVRCVSLDGFKSRASRLAEGLNGRWSNREKAFIMSPSKVEKLKSMLSSGEDYSPITRQFKSEEGTCP